MLRSWLPQLAGVSAALVLVGCAGPTEAGTPTSTAASHREAEGEGPAGLRPTDWAPALPARSPTASPLVTVVEIPPDGTGRFTVAVGESARVGSGRLVRYTVEVEGGLPFDPTDVARDVDATLADPRSWIASGNHAFQRTSADGDVRILLATPSTTDELCRPLRTRGEVSCHNGALVVLNARRWAVGIEAYGDDSTAYRQYVVNHEMGHAIGYGHTPCPRPGLPAPVMLQQTYGLDGCVPNPWPFP